MNTKTGNKTENGIILVTGSNGRIGNAVMRRFAGRFSDVVGLDRKAPSPPPPGCTYIPVEITSDESMREGLRALRDHHGARVASVIHLAAYYDFFGEPSEKYDQITVRGTGRLLRGLHELDFQVEQFVFSSTMLVHRPAEPGQFINEDWPIEPTWAYPESKVRTEQLIHDERGEIPAVLLRISGVYDDLCHSIPLAHQMQRINERQMTSRIYSGSTAHGQSFLHMDDLVDAIALVVERRAQLPPEVPMVMGEPEPLTLRRTSTYVRPPDSRRGIGDARSAGRTRAVGKGGRVGDGEAARRRSVHQTVDDRPRERPLRARHHARPHAARMGAEAKFTRHDCRR